MLADTLTIVLFNLHVLGSDDFEMPASEAAPEARGPDAAESAVIADPIGAMTPLNTSPVTCDPPAGPEETPPSGPAAPKRPVTLCKEAFKRVLSLFARKMETEFHHPVLGRQMSYSDALVVQARQYRRLVEGDTDAYQPLMLR